MGNYTTDEARARLVFLPLAKRNNIINFLKINLNMLPISGGGKMYLWDKTPINALCTNHERLFEVIKQIRDQIEREDIDTVFIMLNYIRENGKSCLLSIEELVGNEPDRRLNRMLNLLRSREPASILKITKFLTQKNLIGQHKYFFSRSENNTVQKLLKDLDTFKPTLMEFSDDPDGWLKDYRSKEEEEVHNRASFYVKMKELYEKQYEITLQGQKLLELIVEYRNLLKSFATIGIFLCPTSQTPFLTYAQ